jgi:RHS repeat-associated protein
VAVGGVAVGYPDGTSSLWHVNDQNGTSLNQASAGSTWLNRCADISMGGAEQVAPSSLSVVVDSTTGAGSWSIYYGDMSITSTNGTVTQINLGAASQLAVQGAGISGTPTANWETVSETNDPTSAQIAATHYLFTDHLGSSQMEFSQGGWPVASKQFGPYGAELNSQTTLDHYKFTGKERDAESGLDYFGARYMSSSMGRFMSPDPTFLNIRRVFNPQRWNMYAYGLNNPLSNVDPDGNEVIPITYPGYQVAYHGTHTLPLGHSGVVLVDRDGTTHYFEFGRYAGPDGLTRNAGANNTPTPSVERDASGNITQDSMNKLLGTLSTASGKGGAVDALVIPTTSAEDASILAYLKARQATDGKPGADKYKLFGGHNCGTLACEAMHAGGMQAPTIHNLVNPFGNFQSIWGMYPNAPAYQYQPKEHVTVRLIFDTGDGHVIK